MKPPLFSHHDQLLRAAVFVGEVHEDFTQGPPILVEMVWLMSRDCVEVRAFDATKPPTEPPFYSESAERVKDAGSLWLEVVGASLRWDRS